MPALHLLRATAVGVVLAAAACSQSGVSAVESSSGAAPAGSTDVGGAGAAGRLEGSVSAAGLGGASASAAGGRDPATAGAAAGAESPPVPPPVASEGRALLVQAGPVERHACPVSFLLEGDAEQNYELAPETGDALPLQRSADGSASFVLPELAAGATARYALRPIAAPASARVHAQLTAERVALSMDGSELLSFNQQGLPPPGGAQGYRRGGYIHPVHSPAGVVLTDDYPGDHRHHHGIWSAWTRTRYQGHEIDFWNQGEGQGKVDFSSLEGTWDGPVHGGFQAQLVHLSLLGAKPEAVLHETWRVTAYWTQAAPRPYALFDLDSTQTAAGSAPIALEQYLYGGFGVRGSRAWMSAANATYLSSEGKDRTGSDGGKARWLYLGGVVDGGRAGLVVLVHPDNFRAPQTFRVHPDEPYVSPSPVKEGAFSIDPGVPYRTRFRFVAIDGGPDPTLLDRLWADYATPPVAQLVP